MGDQRKQVKRGEKDENSGQWKTGTRGAKECCEAKKQIVEKSVVQIGHTSEAGRRERKRPVRRPSSILSFERDGPTGAEERRRRAALAAIW